MIFFSGRGHECRLRFVDAFNFRDVFTSQMKLSRADVLFDLLGTARADDSGGHCRIAQHPRDGDLARRPAMFLTDSSQAVNECGVLRKLGLKKFRGAAAPITVGALCYSLPGDPAP